MTKKDYILLARALKDARTHADVEGGDMRTPTVDETSGFIADALQRDNPRFDRDRFLTACGVN
jgi:hypothetical protein